MNNDLEIIWYKTLMAQFVALPRRLPGKAEEIHGIPYNNRFLGRNLNTGPPEHEAEGVTALPDIQCCNSMNLSAG
jgi:hypothetical protein